MSEYQYHEWQSVDRVLTVDEQEAVNELSSHIEVSSSRAVVTYHWSDFRYDPQQVLLQYFDAYFYSANWGSLRLMFRFPKGLLDEVEIAPYCIGEYVTFEVVGNYLLLMLDFNPDDGGNWMETEASLADFIRLRADLLEGDYRLLYLAWLKAAVFGGVPVEDEEGYEDDYDEDDHVRVVNDLDGHEPPVPAGLKELSPSLQNFVEVFGIDPFLVQAAAEASQALSRGPVVDYRDLVGRLSRTECDEFLTRLAEGDPATGLALRKRLGVFLPQERFQPAEPRTIQQLLQRAEQLEKAEKRRQAAAARQRHIAEMKALAAQEAQVWQQVDTLLAQGRKIASVYDEATALLEKLHQLAEFKDTRDAFQARLGQLAERYSSRPSLIARWRSRGWV